MRATRSVRRRLLLGLCVDEAQSRLDSPEARHALRIAHERHNLGVLHELQIAQRQRDALAPERRCHITRFCKPTVRGFQAYIKDEPTHYVVREVWPHNNNNNNNNNNSDNNGDKAVVAVTSSCDRDVRVYVAPKLQTEYTRYTAHRALVLSTLRSALDAVAAHVRAELTERQQRGALVQSAQQRALQSHDGEATAIAGVLDRLVGDVSAAHERGYKTLSSSSHLLESAEVCVTLSARDDRRVTDAFASELLTVPAAEGGVSYALWVSGGLIAHEALCSEFPFHLARYVVHNNDDDSGNSGNSSKGGDDDDDNNNNDDNSDGEVRTSRQRQQSSSSSSRPRHRLPRIRVEVYFSPELYKLQRLLGSDGLTQLRRFIGRVMMQQHTPAPTSPSLLLNALCNNNDTDDGGGGSSSSSSTSDEVASYGGGRNSVDALSLVDGHELLRAMTAEARVCIPWLQRTRLRLSTLTGVVLRSEHVDDEDGDDGDGGGGGSGSHTLARRREAVQLVWRVWGHLVKDLHVCGDLDCLYVTVDRGKERRENAEYIDEVRHVEQAYTRALTSADTAANAVALPLPPPTMTSHGAHVHVTSSSTAAAAASSRARTTMSSSNSSSALIAPAVTALAPTSSSSSSRQRAWPRVRRYVPLPIDFTVVECTLERCGLPHNMVMEDMTSALCGLQTTSLDMLRLSVVDRITADNDDGSDNENNDDEGGREGGSAAALATSNSSSSSSNVTVVPVLYAPKVVITHAGVIDNGTHSFQRIRIRGSTLAHVQALAAALADGSLLVDRDVYASFVYYDSNNNNNSSSGATSQTRTRTTTSSSSLLQQQQPLPANCSFAAVHNAALSQSASSPHHPARLRGHRLSSTGVVAARQHAGRYAREQTVDAHAHLRVSDEERAFWRTHYYRLHQVRLLHHDRVDMHDALAPTTALSARVQAHLASLAAAAASSSSTTAATTTALATRTREDGADDVGDVTRKTRLRGKQRGRRAHGNNSNNNNNNNNNNSNTCSSSAASGGVRERVPIEKLYEYQCMDAEAETARYDLHVGDCPTYAYDVTLSRIPDADAPHVTPALRSLQSKGFVNYVAARRFASYTHANMHPGLHLLRGEFRAAAQVMVQQYHLDAALRAERQRSGVAYPRVYALDGAGVRLPDTTAAASGGVRSVAAHGSAMQRVLSNALQAAALLAGDHDALLPPTLTSSPPSLSTAVCRRGGGGDDGRHADTYSSGSNGSGVDPCAEAFLTVLGPRVCQMLVHEFCCFLWNSLVNQRIQRYGTFALLPGDLVYARRRCGDNDNNSKNDADSSSIIDTASSTMARGDDEAAAVTSNGGGALVRVSQRDIVRGVYTCHDVLLPVPGADMQLPHNYTADLYIVTLQRHGLVYEPERQQWPCFYARASPPAAAATAAGQGPHQHKYNNNNHSHNSTRTPSSPFRDLNTPLGIFEEELACMTPYQGALPQRHNTATSVCTTTRQQHDDEPAAAVALDAAALRTDLRAPDGNALGVSIPASYRHILRRADAAVSLRASFAHGTVTNPYTHWAHTHLQQQYEQKRQLLQQQRRRHDEQRQTALTAGGAHGGGVRVAITPSLFASSLSTSRYVLGKTSRHARRLSRQLPATPYWLPQHRDGTLRLRFTLPASVYAASLLRELTKSDVNVRDLVDVDRDVIDGRATSWAELRPDQRALYRRYLSRRRTRGFDTTPHAASMALLHQHIFRSGGMRHSLIPSARGYNDISK